MRDAAQVGDVAANLARQPAIIRQQEANVEAARATLAFTEPDARRYDFLLATDAGTVQQKQKADSVLMQSKAQLDNALAALEAARRQLDVIKAQKDAAGAVVEADKADWSRPSSISHTRRFIHRLTAWSAVGAGRKHRRAWHDIEDGCSARPSVHYGKLSRGRSSSCSQRPARYDTCRRL